MFNVISTLEQGDNYKKAYINSSEFNIIRDNIVYKSIKHPLAKPNEYKSLSLYMNTKKLEVGKFLTEDTKFTEAKEIVSNELYIIKPVLVYNEKTNTYRMSSETEILEVTGIEGNTIYSNDRVFELKYFATDDMTIGVPVGTDYKKVKGKYWNKRFTIINGIDTQSNRISIRFIYNTLDDNGEYIRK